MMNIMHSVMILYIIITLWNLDEVHYDNVQIIMNVRIMMFHIMKSCILMRYIMINVPTW